MGLYYYTLLLHSINEIISTCGTYTLIHSINGIISTWWIIPRIIGNKTLIKWINPRKIPLITEDDISYLLSGMIHQAVQNPKLVGLELQFRRLTYRDGSIFDGGS